MKRNEFKRGTHQTTTAKGEAAKMAERIAIMMNETDDPKRRSELRQSLHYWKGRAA